MLRRASRLQMQFSPLALLGLVCIALVVMTGMVQVAHSHASGQPDHDCSLCTSAHQVIHVAALVALFVSSTPVFHVILEPARIVPGSLFFFKLSSRPPPVVPAFA